MKSTILLLLLCIFPTAGSTRDNQRDTSRDAVREYCGQSDGVQPKHEFFYWDCAHMHAASIHDLEIQVAKNHIVPDFAKDKEKSTSATEKVYESNDPHYSRWIFVSGTKAVRYRQLFDGDSWKGIGVTTYCSEDVAECEKFASLSTTSIPTPDGLKFGPPRPKRPPPIVRFKDPHTESSQETAAVPDHPNHMQLCLASKESTENLSTAQASCQCQFEHFPPTDTMTKVEFLNAALNCKHERDQNPGNFERKYLSHLPSK